MRPMTPRRHALAGAAALLLAGCSSRVDDTAAITPDDQHQLNEAAAMLDANSVDADALDDHESSPHD